MSKTKITITGHGGVIDNEALMIRDLLIAQGAKVKVTGTINKDHEEPWRDCSTEEIEIEVNGQPWGG